MKRHMTVNFLILCLLTLSMHACSLPFGSRSDVYLVERTKPDSAPWKYTRTPDLSLTATSQYFVTATQQAFEAEATQQAQAAATAAAFKIQATAAALVRENAITAYTYFEPFAQNTFDWRIGDEDNQLWQGSIVIQDGLYTWHIDKVKETFLTWSVFTPIKEVEDFDVALRIRRLEGEPHQACFGLLFRQSGSGLEDGTYILSVCDNGFYKVLYYEVEAGMDVILKWTFTQVLQQDDWNLLEISARGDDFIIYINHVEMLTFNDNRLPSGSISILIDQYSRMPSQIAIDYFALQLD